MPLKKEPRSYLVVLSLSVLTVMFMGHFVKLVGNLQGRNDMPNDAVILANTLFSETKDIEDAKGIANVIINRTKRPERFGATIQDVVFAPAQFSGVGSNEWTKAATNKFNEEEEQIYKQMLQVAYQAVKGKLKDNTGGADHYANLKLSKPKFSKVYPKTVQIGEHTYFKEK